MLAAGALLAPAVAKGQQTGNVPLLGFLLSVSRDPVGGFQPRLNAFLEELRGLGYVEGRNIRIEYRWAEGKIERLPGLAAELVRLKPDVVVGSDGVAINALIAATNRIPIVMTQSAEPVDAGIVSSLARPGGNVTGVSYMSLEVTAKAIELMKEAFPNISTLAVVTAGTSSPAFLKKLESASQPLGVTLEVFRVPDAAGIEGAFAAIAGKGIKGFVLRPHPIFLHDRPRVVRLAGEKRLVGIYPYSEFVDAGGLMSYAANYLALWRRAAAYVAKILKGARPADLPVEQPSKFELVINLRAARVLGVAIPQSLRLRADRMIE